MTTNRLLHIIASPREEESRTLQVSDVFLNLFRDKFPECFIDELNLCKEELPSLATKRVDGKYILLSGQSLFGEQRESWEGILQHIQRFLSADIYLISTPMWNFTVPYMLKHYIDLIVQPKYLFQYTKSGVEGLAKNKKMFVITSRGGQYASEDAKAQDFQEPYLRLIFGFVGIQDIQFVNAEPMDMGKQAREKALSSAKAAAAALIGKL